MSFIHRTLIFSMIIYVPLFIAAQCIAPMPPCLLLIVALSGGISGIYFFALCKAYQGGVVSVVYPLARSFPLMILTWAGLFLGERPSLGGIVGIGLVVAGGFILPYKRFCVGADGFCLANYLNRSAAWALVAALATSLYSIIDKIAATHMSNGSTAASVALRIEYVYLQNAAGLGIMALAMARLRIPVERIQPRRAILCGIIFLVSYLLIMLALTTAPVSSVMALRQFSIVIAALTSMLWLERDFSWPRLWGVLAIFAGVAMVGLA